jgi:hypothetical protein
MLALVGSWRVDARAGKVADDCFTAFEARRGPAADAVRSGPVPMPARQEKGQRALWWRIGVMPAPVLP